jgi:hypothetical protein
MRWMLRIRTVCVVCAFLLAVTACKKQDDPYLGPILPPPNSIDMEGLTKFISKKKSGVDSSYYNIAWNFVRIWDSISTRMLLTPKLLFLEALNGKEAIYDNVNQIWKWSYTKAIIGDGYYQSVLTGKVVGDSVCWSLTVTFVGGNGLIDFKWLEGQTDSKCSGGWWKLFEPLHNKTFLYIQWQHESDIVQWIKYTKVYETCNEDNCDFIKYSKTGDTLYNAYFDVNVTYPAATARIEWNRTSFAGRIIYGGWILPWDSSLKSLTPIPSN